MGIIGNYAAFRNLCAVSVNASLSLTFAPPGLKNGIVRSSGDFAADGFVEGMDLYITGTAYNDGSYTISDVVGTKMRVTVNLVSEAASPVALRGVYVDPDGMPVWPVSLVESTRVWLPPGQVLHQNDPLTLWFFPGSDAVPHVDDWDWFVSQRTDDATRQSWFVTVQPGFFSASSSGIVNLTRTPASIAEYPLADSYSPEVVFELLNRVHAYCRRRADGHIRWVDVYRAYVGLP